MDVLFTFFIFIGLFFCENNNEIEIINNTISFLES